MYEYGDLSRTVCFLYIFFCGVVISVWGMFCFFFCNFISIKVSGVFTRFFVSF